MLKHCEKVHHPITSIALVTGKESKFHVPLLYLTVFVAGVGSVGVTLHLTGEFQVVNPAGGSS